MKDQVFIGKMDRRVALVKQVKTIGSTGAEMTTNEVVATVWAERKELKSDEGLDDKIVTINEFKYLVRYNPILINENVQHLYVNDNESEYDIYGIHEIGRKQFLEIKCQKRE